VPIVLQSLGTAYDVVIIEFPADDIERIAKLAGDNTAVFVSIVDATEEMVEETEAAVSVAGVETILRVSPEGHDRPGEPSERTAA
jgi:plastocyanin domain-containing protein